MLAGLTLLLLTSSDVKLASPGFSNVNVDAKLATFFSDHFAQQLQLEGGIRVITASEIAALVGLERQRQLLGCSDDDSANCMAELGGALGVDGIITGSVAKLGAAFVVNVKVVSARGGRPIVVLSKKLMTEEEVVDWLARVAVGAADEVRRSLAPGSPADAPSVRRAVGFGPVQVGALIGGVVLAG